jgi:hypothetical protein
LYLLVICGVGDGIDILQVPSRAKLRVLSCVG